WLTMLGASYPIDKWTVIGKYWYMQTAQDFPSSVMYRSKEIGHEIDFELHYAVNANLELAVEADYLIAGNYFKYTDREPDNAYKLAWNVKLTF
ncbi:MAG: hypothetical protein ABIJ37_07245, partial [Pseudomonadota bacterium]